MPDEITGTVMYLERMAMPPWAEVRVALVDATPSDQPPRIIAESTVAMGDRQVPIPFAFELPAGVIDEEADYVLHAEILIDGQAQFQTPEAIPALTLGAPRDGFEIRVHRSF
jgi:uncharacterized lipoprotein YbaY